MTESALRIFRRVQLRLVVLLIAVTVAASGIAGWLLTGSVKRRAIQQIQASERAYAGAAAIAIDQELKHSVERMRMLANSHAFRGMKFDKEIIPELNGVGLDIEVEKRRAFREIIGRGGRLSAMSILRPDGQMYACEPYNLQISLSMQNYSSRDYFRQTLTTHRPFVSDIILEADGRKHVMIDVPIKLPGGGAPGHLLGAFRYEGLSDILRGRLADADVGFLVDRNGKLLGHCGNQIRVESKTEGVSEHPLVVATADSNGIAKAGSNSGLVTFTDPNTGNNCVGTYVPLECGWGLYIAWDTTKALAAIMPEVWQMVLTVAGFMAVVAGIGMVLARNTGKQLENAEHKLQAANKHLEQRVARRTGELAEANKALLGEIGCRKLAEGEIERGRDELEQTVAVRTAELQDTNQLLEEKIAQAKEAETQLLRFRAALDTSADLVALIDRDTMMIVDVNERACSMLGYTRQELFTMGPQDAVMHYSKEQLIGIFGDIAKHDRLGVLEGLCKCKDGSSFVMELCARALSIDEHNYIIVTVRDIRERKANEKRLEEANKAAEAGTKAKDTFLANISHEMRTPLNGIIGMTQILCETETNAEQSHCLESLKQSGESLLRLVNDVLDYARMEAGTFELDPIAISLRQCVGDAVHDMGIAAAGKNCELIPHVCEDVPDDVLADPDGIRQILVSLISNATKFTDEGEIVVRIQAEETTAEYVMLHATVSDTGVGIPAAQLDKVFDAFEQADNSSSRKYKGTGLGLAICNELTKMMGGKIWVDSELGKGSTFHFTLKLERVGGNAGDCTRYISGDLNGLRVLLADTSSTSAMVIGDMLRSWGMRVSSTIDGQQALAEIRSATGSGDPFKMVILDSRLTNEDGLWLDDCINEDIAFGAPSVIVLSGMSEYSERVRSGRDMYCDAHVGKPVRQSVLFDAIMAIISGSTTKRTDNRSQEEDNMELQNVCNAAYEVLLVEDNRVNQKLAAHHLNRGGHEVTVASDGLEAVKAFQTQSFDIILMDVQMPGMDGFEATAAIRQHEIKIGGHVPIVALTAHAMKGDREICIEAGMDDYLTKPIDRDQLLTKISDILSTSASDELPGDNQVTESSLPQQAGGTGDFDIESASKRVGGNVEILKEMSELFLDSVGDMMGRMTAAIYIEDVSLMQKIIHEIRGTVCQFSAKATASSAKTLEEAICSCNVAEVQREYSRLTRCISGLSDELRAFVGQTACP